MRRLPVFLTFLLILSACAPLPQPTRVPTEVPTPEPQPVTVDDTFETSLLASTWADSPGGGVLFLLDPASGKPLPGYEAIPLGYSSAHAFSPDRQTLAIVSYPDERAIHGSLLLVDLAAWKTESLELELSGWVNSLVFSPDGQRLAIAHGESSYWLTMIDLEKRVVTAQERMESFIARLNFTQDGAALMVYRPGISLTNSLSAAPPQVTLLDASELSPRWSTELAGIHDGIFAKDESVTASNLYETGNALYLSPGLAFAPDRDILYIVHPDADQLTTVNFTAQQVKTVKIQPKLSWFERLLALTAGIAHAKIADGTTKQAVVSPDGQFLYIVGVSNRSTQDQQGNFQMEKTPLGLEIVQTRDGSRVQRFDTEAGELSLSPDGHFLYLRDWGDGITPPWTEMFDTANLELIAHKEGLYAMPAPLMNGEFLLVSTSVTVEEPYRELYHMSILQPSDFSVLAKWTGHEFIHWLTP